MTTTTKAMTQAEIETAKTAAVVAHGAVVETWGMGDSIVFQHVDGVRDRLTWDDRKHVKGWVFAVME